MLFSSSILGALAVTVTATNAFLIPPNTDDLVVDSAAAKDPAVTIHQQQGPQVETLDCSTCPYALKSERNGQHEWTNDVANELEINVQVVNNAILFNDVAIYPVAGQPGPGHLPVPAPLTVEQKVKDGAETSMEGLDRALRLSYSLEMSQQGFEDGNTLVKIIVSPMAIDGEMIRVDDVEIKAIKTTDGEIILHSIDTHPSASTPAEAQCTNVMCRVMSKLLSSIARVKSTAKTAAHKLKCLCTKCFHCVLRIMGHKPHHHHNHKGQHGPAAHVRPDGAMQLPTHHHHNHHGWHAKSFLHRIAHIFWVTVKIAFIPILIGIAFGMAASAIGMLVGQAVVFLWLRYRRNNYNDDAPAYEELPTDEKENLEGEVPPPYEDLPTTVKEAVMEKEKEGGAGA